MIDKNTIIGFALIAAILIGFGIYNSPSKEEKAAQQHALDSIALIEKQNQATKEKTATNTATTNVAEISDSAKLASNTQKLGNFASAATGTTEYFTLENENIQVKLANKGARIVSVMLKNYKTFDKKPVYLFNEESSKFNLEFNIENRVINTSDLFFTSTSVNPESVSFKLASSQNQYIEINYSLKNGDYLVKTEVKTVGLSRLFTKNHAAINWDVNLPAHEKNLTGERATTTIYYETTEKGVNYLSETKDDKETINGNLKWFSFKSQFFTGCLIFDNPVNSFANLQTQTDASSKEFVKHVSAGLDLTLNKTNDQTIGWQFYFGPNHYNTLKKYNLSLEKQVPLGWGIFAWVNRFIVIPVFHFLGGFGWNYGIVILCLTLVFKTLLFPLTYKAYLSAAKMRVLKPEMDEINKKYEGGDPLKKQQETMALYRSAGVNPMGGCLPMLLQLPILIALFRFFPSSIELRQQGFLWADDLSSYDSILQLGFNIPFYGDHVSLFALLMTVSTVIYTYTNSQLTPTDPNMAAMKWMMYLMPVVFLGVMNSSSSGLSYYYFIANLITIGQQYAMRKFVDEDAIYGKIQDNKKKPATKSKFQQRLEDMAKQRGIQMPNQPKK
ncbi:MAG: membrane protein insertase YidC [Bacteroidia bacterium]|nr:membrane protein insertase YidC [Bacteroidia bacterium]